MNPDHRTVPLLRLHAIAPHLTTDELLRAVSRVLTGGDTPPGGWRAAGSGRALRHDGFSAVVTSAWDGPELRLRWSAAPSLAPGADRLLSRIAAAAGDRTPAGEERSRPAEGNGYRAWQALMSHWGVTEDALAEVRRPGRLDRARALPAPAAPGNDGTAMFVFDHLGPPKPPPGWLLRSWLAPDTGGFHCSVRPSATGPRLRVETGHSARREQVPALLSAWQTVTDQLTATPARPLSALHLPPRMH